MPQSEYLTDHTSSYSLDARIIAELSDKTEVSIRDPAIWEPPWPINRRSWVVTELTDIEWNCMAVRTDNFTREDPENRRTKCR